MTIYVLPVKLSDKRYLIGSDGSIREHTRKTLDIPSAWFNKAYFKRRVFKIVDNKNQPNPKVKDGSWPNLDFKNAYDGTLPIDNVNELIVKIRNHDFMASIIHGGKSLVSKSKTVKSKPVELSNEEKLRQEKLKIIKSSTRKIPKDFFISPLKWKILIRSIISQQNLMITGHTGCGKTDVVELAAKALGRNIVNINMGSTQDPRVSIIGNISYDPVNGTVHNESAFIKAISTPNTVVLLDELTRLHPEGVNILMSVLDPKRRFLRIDEDNDNRVINVAKNVSFIATANIGNEYTSTRTLDRAFNDRFQIMEMDLLTKEEETSLLNMKYPEQSDINNKLASFSFDLKREFFNDDSEIETFMSTRVLLAVADIISDGFSIEEAITSIVLPYFDSSGGLDSERAHVKKIFQKYGNIKSKLDFQNF